jgi:VWFA-related protein
MPRGGPRLAARRAVTLAGFLSAAVLTGAAPGPQHPAPSAPRFPAAVEVVRLNVLVREGRSPVVGLRAADFEVRDNGVPQHVEHLAYDELPLSIVLALDVSGSLQGEKLVEVKRASLALLDRLRDGDRAALLTFADTLRLAAPLTEDHGLLRRRVEGLEAQGGTSLRDGAFAAMAIGDGVAGRVVAIVFTDGRETVSWLPEWAVVDAAERTEVVVYAVRIDKKASPFLGRVASATGGRVLDRGSASSLSQTFTAILDEFRTRYVLTYTPVGVARKGSHRLDVRLKSRSAKVTVRESYVVP